MDARTTLLRRFGRVRFALTLADSVGIQSPKPSSVFHHSVFIDYSVSMMMH